MWMRDGSVFTVSAVAMQRVLCWCKRCVRGSIVFNRRKSAAGEINSKDVSVRFDRLLLNFRVVIRRN